MHACRLMFATLLSNVLQEGDHKESELLCHVESEARSSIASEFWYSFESANIPGAHIGVIDDGQFSIPNKTPRNWDAAKFKVSFVTATAHMAIVSI